MNLPRLQNDPVHVDDFVIEIALEVDDVARLEIAGVEVAAAIGPPPGKALHGKEVVRLAVEVEDDVVAVHADIADLALDDDRIQSPCPCFQTGFTDRGHARGRKNRGDAEKRPAGSHEEQIIASRLPVARYRANTQFRQMKSAGASSIPYTHFRSVATSSPSSTSATVLFVRSPTT